jgi:hypothetical protein
MHELRAFLDVGQTNSLKEKIYKLHAFLNGFFFNLRNACNLHESTVLLNLGFLFLYIFPWAPPSCF